MHEKIQKRNPHNLTIRQHVFSSFLIKNFCNDEGYVEFFNLSELAIKKVTPKDMVFCTKRAWDERAENGYMKSIEDTFLNISDKIISKGNKKLTETENLAISEMHLLWVFRQKYRDYYPKDIELNGISKPKKIWTKDQQEQLEAKHITALNNEGKIPARNMVGLHIQKYIMAHKHQYIGKKWAIRPCGHVDAMKCQNSFLNLQKGDYLA